MNINEKLANLYQSKWNGLCESLETNGLFGYEYNPLLLNINIADFEKADIRVMMFGQDMSQGDWYQYDRNADILTKCMLAYKTFDNKIGSIYPDKRPITKGMGGGMNSFIKMLNAKYADKNIRYVWNDIIKIGRNTKDNDKRILLKGIECKEFDVLREEIKIIQPQVIVFFTGPDIYWERILQERLGITMDNYREFPQYNIRQIAKLDLDVNEYPFVKYAFRTYHPCYYKGRPGRYNSIIESIVL